jgi:hypothetical protein
MKIVPRNLAHFCLLFRNFVLTSKSDLSPSFPGSINNFVDFMALKNKTIPTFYLCIAT